MDSQFWLKKWEALEIGFHQIEYNRFLLKYFPASPLGVFVPLCGMSADMTWLREHGHRVVGSELSPLACEKYFQNAGLPFTRRTEGAFEIFEGEGITLWAGDFFDLPQEAVVGLDYVYDRAALIALGPELRKRYAERISALFPKVTQLLITLDYPQDEMGGPPFAVPPEEVPALYPDFAVTELEKEIQPPTQRDNPRFSELSWFHTHVFKLRK